MMNDFFCNRQYCYLNRLLRRTLVRLVILLGIMQSFFTISKVPKFFSLTFANTIIMTVFAKIGFRIFMISGHAEATLYI